MYLGIYLKRNNKTKTGKKKKERNEQGSNSATLARCELYLTTIPLRLNMSSRRKVFCLMPFPRKIHRQTPLKMIEPRKTALLTVLKKQQQKQNAFHGSE